VVRSGLLARRSVRDKRTERSRRPQHSKQASREAQDQRLIEDLLNNPRAAGTEGGSDRELAGAYVGPREDQVRQVDADDRHQDENRSQEHVESGTGGSGDGLLQGLPGRPGVNSLGMRFSDLAPQDVEFGESLLHRSSAGRIFLTLAERGGRETREPLLDAHSELARLESALVRQIGREAVAAGARFRCIVLPSRGDLLTLRAGGAPYWRSALDSGVTAVPGAQLVDTSAALIAAHAIEDGSLWARNEHYSPAGNRIVAEAITRALDADR